MRCGCYLVFGFRLFAWGLGIVALVVQGLWFGACWGSTGSLGLRGWFDGFVIWFVWVCGGFVGFGFWVCFLGLLVWLLVGFC